MDNPETGDAWKYSLDLLMRMQLPNPRRDPGSRFGADAHGCGKRTDVATRGNRRARVVRERAVHLHIVEKYSSSAIAVCWRDATSGCYGEQLWKAVTARAGATCALSGLRIRRGDAVFRPWARGYKPINGDSMILASAVEQTAQEACD
ncbi:hypothetical protein bAD24_III10005 [Burkholderia sp. AD24]|nr:hypothetical protein bAD24_III10005 [Burkholderia sp. AD24]